MHAASRRQQPCGEQPENQRECRHYPKINQRFETDPPDGLQIIDARNSLHDDVEDEGRDDHRDQFDETITQGLKVIAVSGATQTSNTPSKVARMIWPKRARQQRRINFVIAGTPKPWARSSRARGRRKRRHFSARPESSGARYIENQVEDPRRGKDGSYIALR